MERGLTRAFTALAWAGGLALAAAPAQGATVFINELHYDNAGGDVGEAVEVAGPAGMDLSGWELVFYNGSNGEAYATLGLSGVLPDTSAGIGVLSFDQSGIQNGPDGLALVDDGGSVQEFLSYEGTLSATSGPAMGLSSTDMGVEESGSTPQGYSLQRVGTGRVAGDFTWAVPEAGTFGAVNTGQSIAAVPLPPAAALLAPALMVAGLTARRREP